MDGNGVEDGGKGGDYVNVGLVLFYACFFLEAVGGLGHSALGRKTRFERHLQGVLLSKLHEGRAASRQPWSWGKQLYQDIQVSCV